MEFIIILLLLILNGIFAMYEIALVSSSKARLETLVGKGNKRAKGVLKQLEEPEKFLSTIQIGITLIGIVSGAYWWCRYRRRPCSALLPHTGSGSLCT